MYVVDKHKSSAYMINCKHGRNDSILSASIYIINNIGLSDPHCGTPIISGCHVDCIVPIITADLRS